MVQSQLSPSTVTGGGGSAEDHLPAEHNCGGAAGGSCRTRDCVDCVGEGGAVMANRTPHDDGNGHEFRRRGGDGTDGAVVSSVAGTVVVGSQMVPGDLYHTAYHAAYTPHHPAHYQSTRNALQNTGSSGPAGHVLDKEKLERLVQVLPLLKPMHGPSWLMPCVRRPVLRVDEQPRRRSRTHSDRRLCLVYV